MRVLLIVEDDRDTNAALIEVLRDDGYLCNAAFDAEQGLRLLTRDRPDLVVLDLKLPRMTGVEFLRQKAANSLVASVPVIVITGLVHPPRLDNVVAVLAKPFSLDALLDLVRRFAPLDEPEMA